MNFTFTMCFTFEAILKLIAYGPGVSMKYYAEILIQLQNIFFFSKIPYSFNLTIFTKFL